MASVGISVSLFFTYLLVNILLYLATTRHKPTIAYAIAYRPKTVAVYEAAKSTLRAFLASAGSTWITVSIYGERAAGMTDALPWLAVAAAVLLAVMRLVLMIEERTVRIEGGYVILLAGIAAYLGARLAVT